MSGGRHLANGRLRLQPWILGLGFHEEIDFRFLEVDCFIEFSIYDAVVVPVIFHVVVFVKICDGAIVILRVALICSSDFVGIVVAVGFLILLHRLV
ncbi:hypothetical protein QVD17_41538 [Tagetes erecta]|uniref:Uncharacterized protein n=1 Tax=Tagetes erecta TaxID=13708 RepID=A0AAD8NEW0_TARER|nr:hypothetical protein QVD17_41538 [Tagetes erecta]